LFVSRGRTRSEALLKAAVVLASIVAVVNGGHRPVGAQAADQATLHIDDSTPRPGQVVQVTGTCPRPGLTVIVSSESPGEDRTGESVVDLASTTADASGAFRVAVTIPADLDPNTSIDGGPRGAWIIAAGCVGGPWRAQLTITLDGSAQSGELANTGTAAAPLALVGLAAVLAGSLLLGIAKTSTRPSARTASPDSTTDL
jgi:hypothetical protein